MDAPSNRQQTPPLMTGASTGMPELKHEELTLLLSLGEKLVAELDLDAVLTMVADAACQVVQAETLTVPMVAPDKLTFTYRAASGKYADLLRGRTLPIHEGACGWVLQHQRPLLFGLGAEFDMNTAAHWQSGMASQLLVPLISRGNIVGGLSAMGKLGDKPFNLRDLTVLTLFANQASIAIDNARLFHKLALEESRLRLVLDSAGEAIYGIDNDGLCTFANPACVRMLGYDTESDLIGRHMHSVLHHSREDGTPLPLEECVLQRSIRHGGAQHIVGEVHWRCDGTCFPVEFWAHPMLRDGHPVGAVITFIDITERKAQEEQIHNLAYFDTLTQLPNRRLLMDRIGQALIASNRSGEYGALMFLDLDNFKSLNDTQGHDVGDLLLIEVARRLVANVRQEDTVSRLGGDEYVVMVENMGSDETAAATQAELLAEKLRSALNAPYDAALGGRTHHSTPSIGVTLFLGQTLSVDMLLKQADVALYQAKDAGRNAIRFFNPAMQAAIDTRSALEAALRRGIEQDELQLYYQPQVDSARRIIGLEALLRWIPTDGPPVSPAQFIPLAETTGLILPIGLWVLQTACAQIKAFEADPRTRDLQIAVNVSARQFRQPTFPQQVREAICTAGIKPDRLKLELTESVVLENVEDVIARMLEIQATGVTFSLDDFGTGFSSLSYLKRLPLDQLKIDQSFVRDISTDPNDAAIVRAIIAMADSLGMNVIAEGVETEAQLAFLKQSGCTHYQGYLFGRPVPIQDLDTHF
jgi:diguanylate cyclase (GGDEF)-like protein/PAS domain S-box-containing protein